jgi:hypothetical protein
MQKKSFKKVDQTHLLARKNTPSLFMTKNRSSGKRKYFEQKISRLYSPLNIKILYFGFRLEYLNKFQKALLFK